MHFATISFLNNFKFVDWVFEFNELGKRKIVRHVAFFAGVIHWQTVLSFF